MMLVSLQRASDHVRRDTTDDDNDLEGIVRAASAACVTYLKAPSFADSNGSIPQDSNGIALDVPEDVAFACLLLVGEWYRNRGADQDGAIDASFGYGYLPRPVVALLYPFRIPTVSIPTTCCRGWTWWGWWTGRGW